MRKRGQSLDYPQEFVVAQVHEPAITKKYSIHAEEVLKEKETEYKNRIL